MKIQYIHLPSGSKLPDISGYKPFKTILILEEQVNNDWQVDVSAWLVNSGCLYMMAWGINATTWDDSVDVANIAKFNNDEIPSEEFVFTTWHGNESLEEVFWYSKNCAKHSIVKLQNTLIIHVTNKNCMNEIMNEYEIA